MHMPVFIKPTAPKERPLDRVLEFRGAPINLMTLRRIRVFRRQLRCEAYAAGGRTPEQQHAIALLADLRKTIADMVNP